MWKQFKRVIVEGTAKIRKILTDLIVADEIDANAVKTKSLDVDSLNVEDLTVTGDFKQEDILQVQDFTIGDSTSDTLTIKSLLGSSIIPKVDNAYDFGTGGFGSPPNMRFRTGYFGTDVVVGNIATSDFLKVSIDGMESVSASRDLKLVADNGDIVLNTLSGGVIDASSGELKIKQYAQAGEPTIPNDSVALWWKTTNNRAYLIWNRAGTQRKVQLT